MKDRKEGVDEEREGSPVLGAAGTEPQGVAWGTGCPGAWTELGPLGPREVRSGRAARTEQNWELELYPSPTTGLVLHQEASWAAGNPGQRKSGKK